MKRIHTLLLLFLTLGSLLTGCLSNIEPVEELVKNARAYSSEGYKGEAVIELKKALRKAPDHIPAILLFDKIYSGSDKNKQMLLVLSRAQQSGVNDLRILYRLAETYFGQKQYKNTIVVIDRISGSHPSIKPSIIARLNSLKAGSLVELGDYPAAEEIYSDLLKVATGIPHAQLGMGLIAIHKVKKAIPYHPAYINSRLPGDQYFSKSPVRAEYSQLSESMKDLLAQGERNIKKALQVTSDSLETNLSMAEILYLQGKLSKSIQYINRILADDQKNIKAMFLLAKANIALGYPQASEHNLRQLLANDEVNLKATNTLAALYLRKGKLEEAAELLKPFLTQGIKDEDLLINKGMYELLNKNPEKAQVYFTKAAKDYPKSAYAHAQLGAVYLSNKQHSQANKEFKEARLTDIGNLEISLGLIQTNLYSGDYKGALRLARTLSGQHPDSPLPLHIQGVIYEYQKNIDRAKDEYEKALLIEPSYHHSRVKLAKFLLQKNRIKESEKLLIQGLSLDKDQIALSTELAFIDEKKGDDDKAISRLKVIILKDPSAYHPKVALGQLYLKTGNINQSLIIKNQLSVIDPLPTDVISFFAEVYQKINNTTGTVAMYKMLHERFPRNSEFLIAYSNELIKKGDLSTAREKLNIVQQIKGSEYRPLLTSLTRLEIQKGNVEVARTHIKSILRTSPSFSNGYILYGDILVLNNEFEKAIKIYLRALKKENNPSIIHKLSNVYLLTGKKKTAANLLRVWLKRSPENMDISLAYINYYQKSGDLNKAIKECNRYLNIQPDNVLILNKLAQLYQNSDKNKSWDFAKRAYKLSPESPEALNMYGKMCIEKVRYSEGLDALKNAVYAAPEVLSYQYHLAEGLNRSGNSNDAKQLLQTALTHKNPFAERHQAEDLLAELESGFFQ